MLRKTLAEVESLLELEPSVRFIAVEGDTDRDLLDWYLNAKRVTNMHVYGIDEIELSDSSIRAFDLSPKSNRDRVVALARMLERQRQSSRALCVIDADFDRVLRRCLRDRLLAYTDYTSMELYCFSAEPLRKLTTFLLRKRNLDVAELMRQLAICLREVFCLRAANERLGWHMRFPRITDFVSQNPRSIALDANGLRDQLLRTNSRLKESATFDATYREIATKLGTDPRHCMRGHDFTLVLHLYLSRRLKATVSVRDPDTTERTLYLNMETRFVENEPLFQRIATL